MGCRIVLVTRLGPSLGVSGDHSGLAVADIRHPDAIESMIAELHRAGDRVAITGSSDDAEDLHTIAGRARVRVPGASIAVEPLPGNPLAVSVISALADDNVDDSAWLHAALDDLRERAWSATWLAKISQLTRPNPSVWQQVRAWAPGAAFLAEQWPTPSVRSANRAPLTVTAQHPGTTLLHSPSDSWVVEAVRAALDSTTSSHAAPVRDVADTYGTGDAVEFVAIPEDFGDRATARARSADDCSACGARHARTSCPYCNMTARVFQGVTE